MSGVVWRRVAGLSGASWVAAAAYGAHGLKGLDAQFVKTWDNGCRMHGFHSLALAMVPALKLSRPHAAGVLFLSGTCIFSGRRRTMHMPGQDDAYAAVLTRDRTNGRFAPYGGGMLILGWLSLAIL